MADGLVSVIATALGSLPLTTFAQNNGVIQMTGVASRHVGKYIAAILVLLGLFPVVGRAFTTIPSPVLGGAMVLMFGLIAIAGAATIGSQILLYTFVAQFYPTALRSTGMGWASGIGRIGAIIGPVLTGEHVVDNPLSFAIVVARRQ